MEHGKQEKKKEPKAKPPRVRKEKQVGCTDFCASLGITHLETVTFKAWLGDKCEGEYADRYWKRLYNGFQPKNMSAADLLKDQGVYSAQREIDFHNFLTARGEMRNRPKKDWIPLFAMFMAK